jgi:hypothetical protein
MCSGFLCEERFSVRHHGPGFRCRQRGASGDAGAVSDLARGGRLFQFAEGGTGGFYSGPPPGLGSSWAIFRFRWGCAMTSTRFWWTRRRGGRGWALPTT